MWEHDGLSEMRLTIEGAEIVRHLVLSGVPGVGPKGISIGNRLDGRRPWTGDIDEVKVWRLNPNRVGNQFLGRPIDKETADCWARYVDSMRAAFAKYPDCAKKLTAGMRDAVKSLARGRDPAGARLERTSELAARYAELWATNNIDGQDMRQASSDLVTWLRLIGGQPDERTHERAQIVAVLEADHERARGTRLRSQTPGHERDVGDAKECEQNAITDHLARWR